MWCGKSDHFEGLNSSTDFGADISTGTLNLGLSDYSRGNGGIGSEEGNSERAGVIRTTPVRTNTKGGFLVKHGSGKGDGKRGFIVRFERWLPEW